MNLKSLLMPPITAWWLSPERLAQLRDKAERARQRRGQRHAVHYFHQVDDPYSALLLQALPLLLQRYDIDVLPHLVSAPADDAAPDRERLVAYSRKDAAWLAARYGLQFSDPGQQPSAIEVQGTTEQMAKALQAGEFLNIAGNCTANLWDRGIPSGSAPALEGGAAPHAAATAEAGAQALAEGDALRQRLGHYSGGMLYYGGEWYWGIDRLHHLETRLQALGAARPGTSGCMFAPEAATRWGTAASGASVDFFFSLRSPYSAIAAHRLFALTQGTKIAVRLRYVLPMVMRGLAVPRSKRMYISLDAAREARRLQVPFGRICDPVGAPTERGLSLMPLAEARGLGQAYVLSFMHGVWAEGLDAGSDKGLQKIATRAGLDWAEARAAMQDGTWRTTAEANRRELLQLGLWGVPSFKVGATAVWGQDRMEAAAMALQVHGS